MQKLLEKISLLPLLFAFLAACTGVPKGIEPVTDFEKERFLGTWYEIARLDHSFERGLSQVTAEYSLQSDGSITVVNQGYKESSGQWRTAKGKAVFVGNSNVGHLKVSFFGPFYASYVIFELDKEGYNYAYITGYNRNFLWLLSRTPKVRAEALDHFRSSALAAGFNIDELIIVDQSSHY